MSRDQIKYAFLGVMVLALGYVIYANFLKPDPRLATYETPDIAQQGAGQGGQPAGGQGAVATPGQGAAQGGGGASRFQDEDYDIDELLASVQEVDFNYELERQVRNPMTPLVGPGRTASREGATPGSEADRTPAIAVARSMIVTGILYDTQNPLAVIDNEVVGVGHEFSMGIRVDSIEANRVVLRVGDTSIPKTLEE